MSERKLYGLAKRIDWKAYPEAVKLGQMESLRSNSKERTRLATIISRKHHKAVKALFLYVLEAWQAYARR